MVVSLYVCEIPNNVTKEDLDNLFSEIEGYIETRTKVENDKRTIAFIDYQTEKDAKCARETLQGFKFTDKDKGLIIKISDNLLLQIYQLLQSSLFLISHLNSYFVLYNNLI